MKRRIKPSYLILSIIIIAIVGISITIPAVYFAEEYSDVMVEPEWTPAVSETPTRTMTASPTSTLSPSPSPTISPSPEAVVNCVYPARYWREHPELWLELSVGDTIYSKDDLRVIFSTTSQGTHHIVMEQLYLANLNIFSGADPETIEQVLGETNRWLQKYMPYKPLTEEARSAGLQLAQILVNFNTGNMGPGFCAPYEALTVTPVIVNPTATPSQTASPTATRVVVTARPTAASTKTKKPDKPEEPTDRPPKPTDRPPKPTDKPEPTDAPPDPTDSP